ncbi:hypothetical protein DPEC_G00283700 [Dallia pectoralis]|uniref:Uncharacterized protein n=1 Tax=Dallia pectoralis TaxID=75939 RepID=A0ACC2FJ68_DALPE|nr:hypothetical protein DPEC_G00283700 [Dallia pectoralis]
MLRKHIQRHTDSQPHICKHCSIVFKTKGNLNKHMKSQAHNKKSNDKPTTGSSLKQAVDGRSEGCSVWTGRDQKKHPRSNGSETDEGDKVSEDGDDDRGDDEDRKEKSGSHEDPSTSTSHLKPPKPPDQNRSTPDRDNTRPSHDTEARSSHHHKPSVCCLVVFPNKKRSQLDLGSQRSPQRSPTPVQSPPSDQPPPSAPPLSPPSPASRLPSTPHLSPLHSVSPRVSLSPLHCSPPRHNLSPRQHSPPSPRRNLSPTAPPSSPPSPPGYHVSASLEEPPLALRSLSPVGPQSTRAGPQGSSTTPARHNLPRDPSSNPQMDPSPADTGAKGDELPHLSPRTRPSHGDHGGVLSHLPLHSQQLAWTPNLMIPIGGIHMVQHRTSPLYSLVTSPTAGQNTPNLAGVDRSLAAQNTHTLTEMDCSRKAGLDHGPLCSPSSLTRHQSTLKEDAMPSTSMHSSYHTTETGEGAVGRAGYSEPLPDTPDTAHGEVYFRRQEHLGSLSQREKTKLLFTGTDEGDSSHTTVARTCSISKEPADTEHDTNRR